ncbi:peptidylprolyl isomerase [Opitutaceae bacterium TAV4]|nr:peptidylprolyl isomerase [Opitutaceae bacterium TAV4]RRK02103.1 peptidylprolyl isomerase [Opitutaceae bacterium TAV3]
MKTSHKLLSCILLPRPPKGRPSRSALRAGASRAAISALCAASAFSFSALSFFPASASADAGSGVLARVSDTDVRTEDIRAALETLDPREQAALARDPNLLNQAVRSLLARQIVLKEALAKKWDQQPAAAAALQRSRDNALVESYLQSVSQPPEGFPSEAELSAFYEASKSQLLVPSQYRLAQIFIAAPKGADPADIDRAKIRSEAVKKQLAQSGADFAAVARAQSDEKVSAERGGEAGWVLETQLRPEIREVIKTLPTNTVSDPVRLDDGWHIVKAIETKEPYTLKLDEVRAQLTQQLRNERARANRQAYLSRLLEQNPMVINELALSQVLAPGK